VLVGVSGGIDSTALLHALVKAGYGKLTVAHLDHGLRGKEGAGDARFVRGLARKWGLAVIVERMDVGALAREEKVSVEMAARRARYGFFARAAKEARCRTIVLAHHADDQAETFLFNLLRGGGTGLGGMRRKSVREIDGVKLEILRPWLVLWRGEIEAYAAREGIRHREDASNASLKHMRNRIRARVIPMLSKEMGRDVRMSLWRAAEVMAAQQEWMGEAVGETGDELRVAAMRELPEALLRGTIHDWLRRHGTPQVSFALVEAICALVPEGAAQAKVNLPGGKFARRRAGLLFIDGGSVR
jgi:tRNA(Ile)-lysidine synthase